MITRSQWHKPVSNHLFQEVEQFLKTHTDLAIDTQTAGSTDFVLPPQSLSYPGMQLLAALVQTMHPQVDLYNSVQWMLPSLHSALPIYEDGRPTPTTAGKADHGRIHFAAPLERFPAKTLLVRAEEARKTLQSCLTIGNDGSLLFTADPAGKLPVDYLLRAALPATHQLVVPGQSALQTDDLNLRYELPEGQFMGYHGPISGTVSFEEASDARQFARDHGDYGTDATLAGARFVSARVAPEAAERLMAQLELASPYHGPAV